MFQNKRSYKNNRSFPNQGQKALMAVFKQSATITSQMNFQDQMSHIVFQKSQIRNKQVKALLEDYPEHFIVNEGKDAKKFQSDNSQSQMQTPLPPLYLAWPSFALRKTEAPMIDNFNNAYPLSLYKGILLASSRFNNQDANECIFDDVVGTAAMQQEKFVKVVVPLKYHLLFLLLSVPPGQRITFCSKQWWIIQLLSVGEEFGSSELHDPLLYIYDHVTTIQVDIDGPYYENPQVVGQAIAHLPLIVIAYLQLCFILETNGVITDFVYTQAKTPQVYMTTANKISEFVNRQENTPATLVPQTEPMQFVDTKSTQEYFSLIRLMIAVNKDYDTLIQTERTSEQKKNVLNLSQLLTCVIQSVLLAERIQSFTYPVFGVHCTFLAQLTGITRTPGFGLIHVGIPEGHSIRTMGVVGVTPESREYLQLVTNIVKAVEQQAFYPSATSVILSLSDGTAIPSHAQPWDLPSQVKITENPKLTMHDLDTPLRLSIGLENAKKYESKKRYVAFLKVISEMLKDGFALESQRLKESKLPQFTSDEILAFDETIDSLRLMQMKDVLDVEKVTEFILPSIVKYGMTVKYDASVAVYKIGLKTVKELLTSEGLITDFYVTCLSRQQNVNSSVYDKATILRSTSQYMETDAQFANGGYQKLNSSIAMTLQCNKNTFDDDRLFFSGSFTSLTQQARTSAETFQYHEKGAEMRGSDYSYGSLLTSMFLNSTQSYARDQIWTTVNNSLIGRDLQKTTYYNSMSAAMEQFSELAPTLAIVRYDEGRLREDSKIPLPQQGEELPIIDRMYYMEPSMSFIDTYSLGMLVYEVDQLIQKSLIGQKRLNARADKMNVDGDEEKDNLPDGGVGMDQNQYRITEDEFRLGATEYYDAMLTSFGDPSLQRMLKSMRRGHMFQYFDEVVANNDLADGLTILITEARRIEAKFPVVPDVVPNVVPNAGNIPPPNGIPPGDGLPQDEQMNQGGPQVPQTPFQREMSLFSSSLAFTLNSLYAKGTPAIMSRRPRILKNTGFAQFPLNHYEYDLSNQNDFYMLSIRDRVIFGKQRFDQSAKEISSVRRLMTYVQCNVIGDKLLYEDDTFTQAHLEEFINVIKKSPFKHLDLNLNSWESVAQILALSKLLSQFKDIQTSVTAGQLVSFLKTVSVTDTAAPKRFLVRFESPRQRIAYADYIDQMHIATFSTGTSYKRYECLWKESMYRLAKVATRADKELKVEDYQTGFGYKFVDKFIQPFEVYYRPQFDGTDSTKLWNANMYQTISNTQTLNCHTVLIKASRHSILDTSVFLSRPQWTIKSSNTYTRRSIAPGLSLLKIKRDPVDIIPINHPSLRVFAKKSMTSTYAFRDIETHLVQQPNVTHDDILQEPQNGMFRTGTTMPPFNTKSVELQTSNFIADRIMRLLKTNSSVTPGFMNNFQKHVGVPFFTPVTRLQLLIDAATTFQCVFSDSSTYGGVSPLKMKRTLLVRTPYAVLGSVYTNLGFALETDSNCILFVKFVKSWTDTATLFFEHCVPLRDDLEIYREYKTKFSAMPATGLWTDMFPILADQSVNDRIPQSGIKFKSKNAGIDRVRFLMQGSYYDFTTLFPNDVIPAGNDVKTLYSHALIYKEALLKYLTSLKLTVQMYPDNPFLIESFAQVYFQSGRSRAFSDLLMNKWNPTVLGPDGKETDKVKRFYLSALDMKGLSESDHQMSRFQHLVVSVFVESLLVKQGCPVDPFTILKQVAQRKDVDWPALISATFSEGVSSPGIKRLMKNILLHLDKADQGLAKDQNRYTKGYASVREFMKASMMSAFEPQLLSLWDKHMTKFVGDPQLLLEVFLETFLLPNRQQNTEYVLDRVANFKQNRYSSDIHISSKVCPQFCAFTDPSLPCTNPTWSTLMETAIGVMTNILVPFPAQHEEYLEWCTTVVQQINTDVSELCQFVTNLFTIQLSAYSRGQTKGIKDSENYTMLKMIQLYSIELTFALAHYNQLLTAVLNAPLFFIRNPPLPPVVVPTTAEKNAPGYKAPPLKIRLSWIDWKTNKVPTEQIFVQKDVAAISQAFASMFGIMQRVAKFDIYVPRVSISDKAQEVNKDIRDASFRMRVSIVADDTRLHGVTLITLDALAKKLVTANIIGVNRTLMEAVESVLSAAATGLQFVSTVYHCSDGVLTTLQIQPLLGVDDQTSYNLYARPTSTVNEFEYAETYKQFSDINSWKRMFWKRVQRRLTELSSATQVNLQKTLEMIVPTFFTIPQSASSQLEKTQWMHRTVTPTNETQIP